MFCRSVFLSCCVAWNTARLVHILWVTTNGEVHLARTANSSANWQLCVPSSAFHIIFYFTVENRRVIIKQFGFVQNLQYFCENFNQIFHKTLNFIGNFVFSYLFTKKNIKNVDYSTESIYSSRFNWRTGIVIELICF